MIRLLNNRISCLNYTNPINSWLSYSLNHWMIWRSYRRRWSWWDLISYWHPAHRMVQSVRNTSWLIDTLHTLIIAIEIVWVVRILVNMNPRHSNLKWVLITNDVWIRRWMIWIVCLIRCWIVDLRWRCWIS